MFFLVFVFFSVIVEGRNFSYKCVDMSRINVMLNTKDVSEYLKISPDGLEVSWLCCQKSYEGIWNVFDLGTIICLYATVKRIVI